MEANKKEWFKPAIESTGTNCGCCGTTTVILPLNTKLYYGFGGWNISKNGVEFFKDNRDVEFEDYLDLNHVENLIGDNVIDEFTAFFNSPLRDATYQRHSKNNWVLINKGDGFA